MGLWKKLLKFDRSNEDSAVEQYSAVVLFDSRTEFSPVQIRRLFNMLYNLVQTFESVVEILTFGHSNKSNAPFLACGAVPFANFRKFANLSNLYVGTVKAELAQAFGTLLQVRAVSRHSQQRNGSKLY